MCQIFSYFSCRISAGLFFPITQKKESQRNTITRFWQPIAKQFWASCEPTIPLNLLVPSTNGVNLKKMSSEMQKKSLTFRCDSHSKPKFGGSVTVKRLQITFLFFRFKSKCYQTNGFTIKLINFVYLLEFERLNVE